MLEYPRGGAVEKDLWFELAKSLDAKTFERETSVKRVFIPPRYQVLFPTLGVSTPSDPHGEGSTPLSAPKSDVTSPERDQSFSESSCYSGDDSDSDASVFEGGSDPLPQTHTWSYHPPSAGDDRAISSDLVSCPGALHTGPAAFERQEHPAWAMGAHADIQPRLFGEPRVPTVSVQDLGSNCRYGVDCYRQRCEYVHPEGYRAFNRPAQQPQGVRSAPSSVKSKKHRTAYPFVRQEAWFKQLSPSIDRVPIATHRRQPGSQYLGAANAFKTNPAY